METEKIKIDSGHNQMEASTTFEAVEKYSESKIEQAEKALEGIQNKVNALLQKAGKNPYTYEQTFPATLSDGLAIIKTFNDIMEIAKKSIELLTSKKQETENGKSSK